MQTTSLAEAELSAREKIKRIEKTITPIEPKRRKDPAAAERQRILALMAGMRKQFVREMDNVEKTDKNADVLLILNAKIIAIEQVMEEIEHG